MSNDELFDHVYIWADGSIQGNPDGEGGIGIFIESKRKQFVRAIGKYVPARDGNTNNRMELQAAIEALKELKDVNLVVHLYLDSMYVVGGIKAGGYVSNKDLWRKFFDAKDKRENYLVLNVEHVKGHSGESRNIAVDRLANLAREQEKDIEFVGHPEEIIRRFGQ